MNPFTTAGVFFPLYDIAEFHERFGLQQNIAIVKLGEERDQMSAEEWKLRNKRLMDEAAESEAAHADGDDNEYLDALVDICYIALGTAYRRGWDFAEAWRRVHVANMTKERGEAKTSKYGSSYDIVKPVGWKAPDHADLVNSGEEA